METERERAGLAWQVSVWDRMSDRYLREVDRRFAPLIERLVARADLRNGERVLDLGTGTGSVAILAASRIAPDGHVTAVDPSPQMLALARRRVALGEARIAFHEGRGEAIPAEDRAFDAVLASLSLMYAVDRGKVAREIARVLRPGGRLVAAAWGGAEHADIVRLQETAARFAPEPPVPGVGPGALARPANFLTQLAEAGVETQVETEVTGFDFASLDEAWDVLAGVTAAQLPPERQAEAKAAVRAAMWSSGDGPRHFANLTQFLIGRRR